MEMFITKEPNNIQPFDILENSNIDLTDIASTEIPKTFKPTFDLENRIYENLVNILQQHFVEVIYYYIEHSAF
jgi:hypothetical protein